jgi:hypothetical protein
LIKYQSEDYILLNSTVYLFIHRKNFEQYGFEQVFLETIVTVKNADS